MVHGKGKLKEEEETLESQINNIAYEVRHSPNNVMGGGGSEQLANLNKPLKDVRTHKIKGTILRSKAIGIDKGEKPSHYFLNLENRKYVSKLIIELILSDGKEIKYTKNN